jgi:hypothetical protein
MKSGVEKQLLELVAKRNALLKKRRTKKNESQVDELAERIWDIIIAYHKGLSIENIIESITSLGGAPSILYDDNGHFTIGEDGSQNLPTFDDDWETKDTTFQAEWWIKPGMWKNTIREALEEYIKRRF